MGRCVLSSLKFCRREKELGCRRGQAKGSEPPCAPGSTLCLASCSPLLPWWVPGSACEAAGTPTTLPAGSPALLSLTFPAFPLAGGGARLTNAILMHFLFHLILQGCSLSRHQPHPFQGYEHSLTNSCLGFSGRLSSLSSYPFENQRP